VLLRAKCECLVCAVAPLLDPLEALGVGFDPWTRQAIVRVAGEESGAGDGPSMRANQGR
jgi:hypothetical protein